MLRYCLFSRETVKHERGIIDLAGREWNPLLGIIYLAGQEGKR